MKNTLKNSFEFRAARKGRYVKGAGDRFTIVASRKLDAADDVKIAIITGAKVGNAVERNRLRRVARVVLSEFSELDKNFIVTFTKGAGVYYTGEGKDELARDLRAALNKF